ncbi:19034_t:CDS:2, partial [Racocetra fulgida]
MASLLDEWIRHGFYKLGDNYIMGSDGKQFFIDILNPCYLILFFVACGTVEEVKDEKYDNFVGKQVIIYPYLEWENDARSSRHVLKILGGPVDGTFCERIVVPAKNLMEKPDHLTPEQAATLPIAGLVGETVLITGSGGGCGLFLIQFAKAFGAKVFFTTGQKYKLNFLENKFNIKGVLYTEVNWSDKLKQIVSEEHGGFFDMIIDSLTIIGSDLGNFTEFKSMINFIIDYKIVPLIDSVVPFDRIMEQFTKMERREQIG